MPAYAQGRSQTLGIDKNVRERRGGQPNQNLALECPRLIGLRGVPQMAIELCRIVLRKPGHLNIRIEE